MKTFFEQMKEKLPGVICDRCGATLLDYGDQCEVKTGEKCPGLVAINQARFELGAVVRLKPVKSQVSKLAKI